MHARGMHAACMPACMIHACSAGMHSLEGFNCPKILLHFLADKTLLFDRDAVLGCQLMNLQQYFPLNVFYVRQILKSVV